MLRLRRTQRDSIAGELRDHLIEHVAHLEAIGITHEEAVRRALEEFGDAAALAAGFSALVGMRRRRLIMRCTIGTTIVMTGLVLAMLAFRPPVIDDPSIAKAQAEATTGKATEAPIAPPAERKGSATSRNEEFNTATRRKLDTLIDVDFDHTPLSEALKFVAKQVDAQFYIDPKSLADAAISLDTPVSLQLKQVPAEMALDLVLRSLQCGYTLRSGVVIVLTQPELDNYIETRVYYLPQDSAHELAELIPGALAPTTWEAVGGPGSIRVFRDSLVISQTAQVHQKIEKLLKDIEPILAQPAKPRAADDAASGYGTGRGGYGVGRGGYGAAGAPARGGYGSAPARK